MTGDYDFWDFDESEYPCTADLAPAGSKLALPEDEQAWLAPTALGSMNSFRTWCRR